MSKTRFIGFIACLSFLLSINGQEAGVAMNEVQSSYSDSNYYESYRDYFIPYIYTIKRFSSFNVADKLQRTTVRYKPNANQSIGLGFSYQWLGLAGSTALRFMNKRDDKYGHTESFDLYTNFYSTKIIYDLNLQWYSGYYISNPKSIDPNWTLKNPYPYRKDISTLTIGGGLYHTLNHQNFSFRAPYSFTERQLQSAGSIIVGGFLSLYVMSAVDSAIIPSQVQFSDSANLTGMVIFDIGSALGYAYTFVIKEHFFISFAFLPGFSLQTSLATNAQATPISSPPRLAFKSQLRASFGYSKKNVYTGLYFVNDSFNKNTSLTSSFQYVSGYTCLVYGWRFDLSQLKKRKSKNL